MKEKDRKITFEKLNCRISTILVENNLQFLMTNAWTFAIKVNSMCVILKLCRRYIIYRQDLTFSYRLIDQGIKIIQENLGIPWQMRLWLTLNIWANANIYTHRSCFRSFKIEDFPSLNCTNAKNQEHTKY